MSGNAQCCLLVYLLHPFALCCALFAGCDERARSQAPPQPRSPPSDTATTPRDRVEPRVAPPLVVGPEFEIIAHRGVYQNFHRDGLTNETCTATRIDPPSHGFLENTIASMAEAFRLGATMVEIDVHRTADDRVVVFHDWTLDCRTEGKGVTREHTLAYLQQLDIGYGYTADNGETFPFRGKGVGLMPSLVQVLERFPDKRFLINQKDRDSETAHLIGQVVASLPAERRTQLYYWGHADAYQQLAQVAPEVTTPIMNRKEAKQCAREYLRQRGLPEACLHAGLPVPAALFSTVANLVRDARAAGNRVYGIGVDSTALLRALDLSALDGIVTEKIEVIGPQIQRSAKPMRPSPSG